MLCTLVTDYLQECEEYDMLIYPQQQNEFKLRRDGDVSNNANASRSAGGLSPEKL